MSVLHDADDAPSLADATASQPRPRFDGDVPVVHSVSRFGRNTTRITAPHQLNTSTDQTTQQPSAPEQSPVMVYSRVGVHLPTVQQIGLHRYVTRTEMHSAILCRSSPHRPPACRFLHPCFRLRVLIQTSWPPSLSLEADHGQLAGQAVQQPRKK